MSDLDSQGPFDAGAPGADSNRRLIQGLTADLEPVRRVPALRTSLGFVLAVASGVGVVVLATDGFRPALGEALLSDAAFGGVFLGVLVLAPAATLAALAASIPGREDVVRLSSRVAAVGLVAVTALVGGLTLANGFDAGSPLTADAMCFRRVLKFAAIPVALVVGFVLRGWVHAPTAAAGLALLGAGAMGALITHLSCTADGARHLMMSHVLPVYVLGVVGGIPLLLLLRRFTRT